MLNEEEKKIVEFLRMSPKDSLKRDAADLIESLDKKIDKFNLAIDSAIAEMEQPSLWKRIRKIFK